MKLKNINFIFILFLIIPNISYASFPISDSLTTSCQIIKNDSDSNKKLTIYKSSSSKQMYRTAIILFGISIITFAGSIIHLINCIDDSSKCDGSGMPYLYLSMIFGFSSIIALIKGISISSKNKKKIKQQN